MPANNDLKHILIMDDSLGTFLRAFRVDPQKMFEGSGLHAEVEVAQDARTAEMILAMWADQGIKPDIVSTDFLYGHDIGPVAYAGIARRLYKDRKELAPAKLFVHSKSGLQEYTGPSYSQARQAMEETGAEYCHTNELISVARKFGGKLADAESFVPASTRTFRDYLRQQFGLDVSSITREEIERNREEARVEDVGRHLDMYDACVAVDEGAIDPAEAVRRLSPEKIKHHFETKLVNRDDDGRSLDDYPVSFKKGTGGAVTGVAAFTKEEVQRYKAEGKKVILVLEHFRPGDVGLLAQVDGVVLLGRGSSHLPILCDNFGIPGIFQQAGTRWMGQADNLLSVHHGAGTHTLVSALPEESKADADLRERGAFSIASGQAFSIGTTHYNTSGSDEVIHGGELFRAPLEEKMPSKDEQWTYQKVMPWIEDACAMQWHRRDKPDCHALAVKANADTLEQMVRAAENDAGGIGLLRTEHMCMMPDRLSHLQTYMLAGDDATKQAALAQLRAAQKQDFIGIYKAASRIEQDRAAAKKSLLPFHVTVRLLDAKPDELLPPATPGDAAHGKIAALIKANQRGAQFAVAHPELYAAQLQALFEAAKETGIATPTVMVPMVRNADELAAIKQMADEAAKATGYLTDGQRRYQFGAMIETMDAVKNAGAIARQCDFLSFGTNDLTAEVTGLARDNIEAIDQWTSQQRQPNPFKTLAPEVRTQMEQAIASARAANPRIALNACGGQVAGDKESIAFCQRMDMDAISVPATLGSIAMSRIICAQEALHAYDAVRQHNTREKKVGGQRVSAIDPAEMQARKNATAQRSGA